MQTAKFVVLFLIWSAKTKSSVTVKMLNSYKVVTKQKGVRIMRQYHETEKKEIQKLAKMYREFLDAGKTERECSSNICRIAKEQGFENLEDVIREGKQLKAGDKILTEMETFQALDVVYISDSGNDANSGASSEASDRFPHRFSASGHQTEPVI